MVFTQDCVISWFGGNSSSLQEAGWWALCNCPLCASKLICISARPAKFWPCQYLVALGIIQKQTWSFYILRVPWTHYRILGLGWYIPFFLWAQPASRWQGSQITERENCLFTNCSWIFKCACWPLIVAASLDLLLDNALGHGCWRGSKWTELLVQHVKSKANRQGCAKFVTKMAWRKWM